MEHWAPVIQTLLWVGLIGFAGWKYQPHVERLLTALQKRIDSGGAVKIGPVSLEEIRPQTEEAQREAVEAEVALAAEEPPDAENREAAAIEPEFRPVLLPLPSYEVAERALLMEDLALRALQVEFGSTIARQVAVAGFRVDGIAVVDDSPHLFEIKYAREKDSIPHRLEQAAERLQRLVLKMNWHNAKVIVCQVYETEGPSPSPSRARGRRHGEPNFTPTAPMKVSFRAFHSAELLKRFGVPTV